MSDVHQRIARLEGLLARIQKRRGEPRGAGTGNGQPAVPVAEARPETLPPEAYDEVVDLHEDDIVELRDSAAPPRAQSSAPPPVASEPPAAVVQAYDMLPHAQEPEPSYRPPPNDVTAWPSSVPPEPSPPMSARLAGTEPISGEKRDYGLDFDDEEPPASSQRPIASSMDEALAEAAAREVPLKTPPPESGPQEAVIMPKGNFVAAPDVDDAVPGASEASQIAQGFPTSAQLGNTVTLDEGERADFEVEEPVQHAVRESSPVPSEDYEMRLPSREAGGTYDENLAPPPEARSELDAHRERRAVAPIELEPEPSAPVPEPPPPPQPIALVEPLGASAPIPSAPPLPLVDAHSVEAQPDNTTDSFERPPTTHAGVTTITGAPPRFRPGSFLELLDASLKLGKD